MRTISTDPLRNFKYHVNIPKYGMLNLGFSAVSGLAGQTEPIGYREGGDNTTVRQMPGQTSFPPVVLSRGVFAGDSWNSWYWFREIFSVIYGGGRGIAGNNFRTDFVVNLLDHPVTLGPGSGAPGTGNATKMAWRIYNAWPASLAYSDLDAAGNGIMVDQLTLVHEGMDEKFAPGEGQYLSENAWA